MTKAYVRNLELDSDLPEPLAGENGDAWECPTCGSLHLHQCKVVVGFRSKEDDNLGTVVTIEKQEGEWEPEGARVVSSVCPALVPGRRDHLTIYFWCEECTARRRNNQGDSDRVLTCALQIWQHKGFTLSNHRSRE